jgi:hypothetical protein
MAMSTTEIKREGSAVAAQRKKRSPRWWSIVCASFLLLFLILGGLFASHYQPIVFAGGWGSGHSIAAHEEEETQAFWLRNTGPIGVTVVSLKSVEYDGMNSQVRLAPAMICSIVTPRGGDCSQNRKTGLLEGIKFHPFSLTTDETRPVLLKYKYPCVSYTVVGPDSGTLTLPVTYRFLWFTHTISVTESAFGTTTCSKH